MISRDFFFCKEKGKKRDDGSFLFKGGGRNGN